MYLWNCVKYKSFNLSFSRINKLPQELLYSYLVTKYSSFIDILKKK